MLTSVQKKLRLTLVAVWMSRAMSQVMRPVVDRAGLYTKLLIRWPLHMPDNTPHAEMKLSVNMLSCESGELASGTEV